MTRNRLAWIAAVAMVVAWPAMAELPSVKFMQGTRVAPSTGYYGSATTHSTSVPGVTRAIEIRQLALSLGKDKLTADVYAQRVHEYIYNNIRTTFIFGLQKGALGTLLDQAGTPFDQASLMVELLREAGITANYQIGTITLTATQASGWMGLTNARATCRLLVDGGIPATVNGSSSSTCSLSGNVTSVQMRHVWVSAASKLWDPSFKVHTTKTGINLATATQCGSNLSCSGTLSAAASAATTAVTTGANTTAMTGSTNSIRNVNRGALETQLTTWANNLKARINIDRPTGGTDDVVGGASINSAAMPVPGTTLVYGNPASITTWTEVPDQYRTTFRVVYDNLDKTLFVDEVAGRRLRIQIQVYGNNSNPQGLRERWSGLYLESTLLAEGYKTDMPLFYQAGSDVLTLHVNHPYAASSGAYMDDSFIAGEILAPLFGEFPLNPDQTTPELIGGFSTALVHSWGTAGRGTISAFSELERREVFGEGDVHNTCPAANMPSSSWEQMQPLPPWSGTLAACVDSQRFVLAAQYFAQTTRAADLIDAVNTSITTQHRSIGVVAWNGTLNVESSVSVNSKSNTTSDRRSTIYSYALLSSRLEGGVTEQLNDAWEGQSASGAIARSNENSIRLARFTSVSNYVNTSGMPASFPEINSAAQAYLNAGFNIVVPQIKTPLAVVSVRKWNPNPSIPTYPANTYNVLQPSGLYAIRPSAADSTVPDRIAMLMQGLGHNQVIKGGGADIDGDDPVAAAAETTKLQDASQKAKMYFGVDLASAAVRLTPAADLATGSAFPLGLSFQRFYNSNSDSLPHAFVLKRSILESTASPLMQEQGNGPPEYNAALVGETNGSMIGGGWDHNWHITASISSDAFQGMGEDSPIDAIGAITAIYTIRALTNSNPSFNQLVTANFASNWFGAQLAANTVVVRRPPNAAVFTKLPDGTFNGPSSSAEILVQSGQPSARIGKQPDQTSPEVPVVRDYSGVTFTLTDKLGSQLSFNLGSVDIHPGDILGQKLFKATQWRFPTGVVVSFSYAIGSQPQCLTGVSNNAGRSLTFVNETPTYVSLENGLLTPPPYQQCHVRYVRDENNRTVELQRPGATNIYGHTGNAAYFGALLRFPELRVVAPDGTATRYVYTEKLDPATSPRVGRAITSVYLPGEATAFETYAYDDLNRLTAVTDALGVRTDYLSAGFGNERLRRGSQYRLLGSQLLIDDAFFDVFGRTVQSIDPLGNRTSSEFDGRQRLVRVVYPELNEDRYKFDLRSNLTEERAIAKPGSGLVDLVKSTLFPTTCTNVVTCNLPSSSTDARSNTTTYAWNPTTGQLDSLTSPAVAAGTGFTQFGYQLYGPFGNQFSLLETRTERIRQTPSVANTVTRYTYNNANKYVLDTATVDHGGLNLISTYTFDAIGNIASVNGPVTGTADTTTYNFDSRRRLTRVFAPRNSIARYTYSQAGLLLTKRQARVVNPADSTPSSPWPSDLDAAQWQTETLNYWPTGDLRTRTNAEGHVTSYDYDALGRLEYETSPIEEGIDRKKRFVYDLAGNRTEEYRGWGSTNQIRYSRSAFTPNGDVDWSEDPVPSPTPGSTTSTAGSRTDLVYDGHNRLWRVVLPHPTTGLPNSTCDQNLASCTPMDFEQYGYDANGNRTSKRNRSGRVIGTEFDAINAETTRTVPANAAGNYARTLTTTYDLLGRTRVLSAEGQTIDSAYDNAGRLDSVTDTYAGNSYVIDYTWNDAANTFGMTWPGGGSLTYVFDELQRLDRVTDDQSVQLLDNEYDVLSQRDFATFGNGTTADYGYYPDGKLQTLVDSISGRSVTYGYERNRADQIKTLTATVTNPSGSWAVGTFLPAPPNTNAIYVPNKRNQYSTVGGTTYSYDANGNLTSDGAFTFEYDEENRLRTATPVGQSTPHVYEYDPAGRRRAKTVNGTKTIFLSAGDEEIEERNGANNAVLRKYAYGSESDQRIAMYDTALCGTRCFYHVNHQGSTVALTNQAGTLIETYGYDAYGISSASPTGNPFRYTGRRFDPETGLYYYRARYYSPAAGRFLQTDPIGTADDLNLYAYVGNDPVNMTDPSGMCPFCVFVRPMPISQPVLRPIPAGVRQAIQQAQQKAGTTSGGRQVTRPNPNEPPPTPQELGRQLMKEDRTKWTPEIRQPSPLPKSTPSEPWWSQLIRQIEGIMDDAHSVTIVVVDDEGNEVPEDEEEGGTEPPPEEYYDDNCQWGFDWLGNIVPMGECIASNGVTPNCPSFSTSSEHSPAMQAPSCRLLTGISATTRARTSTGGPYAGRGVPDATASRAPGYWSRTSSSSESSPMT